jgi:hypothetical protein
MKHRIPVILSLFVLLASSPVEAASSAEPAPLLPESVAARSEMAASQKTLTIFLKEEDPEKATQKLNTSSEEYGKKGWTVFSILPYVRDEDFQGFFITYQKSLIIE